MLTVVTAAAQLLLHLVSAEELGLRLLPAGRRPEFPAATVAAAAEATAAVTAGQDSAQSKHSLRGGSRRSEHAGANTSRPPPVEGRGTTAQ